MSDWGVVGCVVRNVWVSLDILSWIIDGLSSLAWVWIRGTAFAPCTGASLRMLQVWASSSCLCVDM